MKQVSIGIIGTGWCGGIRAETCASSPSVSALHLAEIKPERLREVAGKTKPATATADYGVLLQNNNIDAIMISASPETTHFPMAKESLLAGKHVFLEKPMALELSEADELINLARTKGLLRLPRKPFARGIFILIAMFQAGEVRPLFSQTHGGPERYLRWC